MKLKAFCIYLCFSMLVSCSYHFYTKEEAIKLAKKRDVKSEGKIVIEDSGKILKVLVRDSNFQKLNEVYKFDDDGKQLRYSLSSGCDSCFQKYLTKIIASEKYQWKKQNDSTYLSKYILKRILKIHTHTYSYDIVKHNLSKKEYEQLLERSK